MPQTIFPLSPPVLLPIEGEAAFFPARRVYCVGANYAAHAKEMGRDTREPPFFFAKPANALLPQTKDIVYAPYPTRTENMHPEVELVLALDKGGSNIEVKAAEGCIYGYAVGLDMTRRDMQNQFKEKRQPWDMAKGFDYSAPISKIFPRAKAGDISGANITLLQNGAVKQKGKIADMVWNPGEIIAHLSTFVRLEAGDLIFTGTPEGVGAALPSDLLEASCGPLRLQVKIQ